MSELHAALPDLEDETAPALTPAPIDRLLARAAELATVSGLDADAFIHAAWTALLDARPELRAKLEDKRLKSDLRKLRKRGLVGSA